MGGRGRSLVVLALMFSIALMAAGCAGQFGQSMRAGPGPQVVAAPPPAPRPDLDNLMYAGGPAPVVSPIAAAVPVVEASPVYLLDSGDRLRIVVFGQDGLSNSYVVDAAGNITMPLIGAVAARGTSTTELARVIGARLRNGFIREPHVAIEIESYRPFFILGEVTYPG
ncbi:MAG TPA: polysaccharide biosynthesis/export family protein, partial [Xanthobacteraceae bacterium]